MHGHGRKTRRTSRASSALALLAVGGLVAAGAAAQPPAPTGDTASALVFQRRARDAQIAVQDFTAALDPARAAVAAQRSQPDASFPKDLAVLARVQAELGAFDDAEANYLKAIEVIQKAEGEFTISLVDPYRGLGRMYIRAARYPDAITALESAQTVTQRNLGLFNMEQAPLIDEITTAYLGLGDTVEARRMQQTRLDNAVRRFGADDPRVIPYRYELANYYERSRLPKSARAQYEEVLKSQETRLGSTDAGLLNPLRELVKLDLIATQGGSDDSRSRLASILEQNADVDLVERGLSLAALGDWATVKGDTVAARDYYKQAWDALRSNPAIELAEMFAAPAMIDFVPPLSPVDRAERPRRAYGWGEIVLRFDVSADGRPFAVETVGDAPPEPYKTRYTRRVREAHFRPRLRDGEPVATTGVQFKHYFRVYLNPKDASETGEDE